MTPCQARDVCCSAPPGTGVWVRIGLGAFLAGNSMTIALAVNLSDVEPGEKLVLQFIPLLAAVAVAALLGGALIRAAWRSVRAGRVTIDSLFVLCIIGAFTASAVSCISGVGPVYFEVVSILLVVYSLGQALARYTKSRVLSALAEWDPALMTCEVLSGGRSERKSVADVRSGDFVRVHPGSMIPVDGVIADGQGLIQEGGISGELLAASRGRGEKVLAGTHVVDATLMIQATVDGSDRSLDRIAGALVQALNQPGESQITADRIARWFVPAVVITAVATYCAYSVKAGPVAALFNAMAVLLVACPCAVGFATPVAVCIAMRRLQALGLHVTRGDAIEKLASVDLAIFDKTGTLGMPDPAAVLQVKRSGERAEVAALVRAAEGPARHPFARVLAQIHSDCTGYRARSLRLEPGRGIAAEVETASGFVRSVRIVGAPGTPDAASLAVEVDGRRAATILVHENRRPHANTVRDDLRKLGVDAILMTGDRAERTTQFGFTNVYASLTAEHKVALISEFRRRGRRMLFVGDGANDAAAMAASDVSIAVGEEHGLPQQVASIVWPSPAFDRLAETIVICRHTLRVIRSNVHLALVYNVIGIAFAAAGLLHPITAVLLMTASSCIVILRSLWLLDEESGTGDDGNTP